MKDLLTQSRALAVCLRIEYAKDTMAYGAADTIATLIAELDRIQRVAARGTVTSFLALSDDDKRVWFAMAIEESERRKSLEVENESLRDGWEANTALRAELEAAQKERDFLEIINEECKMDWSGDVTQIRAEHTHELEAAQADAARYRFLTAYCGFGIRHNGVHELTIAFYDKQPNHISELGDAIDAAIAEQNAQGKP